MDRKKAGKIEMSCNICKDNNTLYLYIKKDYIFSLCRLCLNTQDTIDMFNAWAYEQEIQAKIDDEKPS